jgi:hypothetical protein
MDLDELDELEDDEEEKILDQYRRQRMAQIKDLQAKSKYGDVREISAEDYVAEVSINPTTGPAQDSNGQTFTGYIIVGGFKRYK